MPFDMTQKGFEYAIANGPFALFSFLLIIGIVWLFLHSNRIVSKQSAAKERLNAQLDTLQEKRVLERDEIMRALVTTGIALDKVTISTDANNRAIEAHTRAVDGAKEMSVSLSTELRGLKDSIAILSAKVERLLEPRPRR